MTKSEIFITLINTCKTIQGFNKFKQWCIKDPQKYFKNQNIEHIFDLLTNEEKDIFRSEEKFFNLLVSFNMRTDKKNYQTKNTCVICGNETEFVDLKRGYKKTCSKPECTEIRRRNTKKEIYGDENYNNKEQIKKTYTEKDIKEKRAKCERTAKTKELKYGDPKYNNKKKYEETCLKRYGVSNPSKLHILNVDKLKDLDFIIENFSEQKVLDRTRILEFFNIGASFYQKKILRPLKELGFVSKKKKCIAEQKFLCELEENLNVKIKRQYKIKDFKVDGYNPKTKTVYEFLGDYWYGNPEKYNPEMFNANTKTTFSELYRETFIRLDEIKKLGFNVCFIWEKDYKEKSLEYLLCY